jgi:general stress protein 26
MSRRDAIKLSEDEVLALLDEERVVTCASHGTRGWPHLMPLWYVVRDGRLWAWTFAKSQKVRNLERDDRATLQIETGHEYSELRGVMLKTRVAIHRDVEEVAPIGMELAERYGGAVPDVEEAKAAFRKQAAKRVGLQFVERRRVTWDHRKLGGTY